MWGGAEASGGEARKGGTSTVGEEPTRGGADCGGGRGRVGVPWTDLREGVGNFF